MFRWVCLVVPLLPRGKAVAPNLMCMPPWPSSIMSSRIIPLLGVHMDVDMHAVLGVVAIRLLPFVTPNRLEARGPRERERTTTPFQPHRAAVGAARGERDIQFPATRQHLAMPRQIPESTHRRRERMRVSPGSSLLPSARRGLWAAPRRAHRPRPAAPPRAGPPRRACQPGPCAACVGAPGGPRGAVHGRPAPPAGA